MLGSSVDHLTPRRACCSRGHHPGGEAGDRGRPARHHVRLGVALRRLEHGLRSGEHGQRLVWGEHPTTHGKGPQNIFLYFLLLNYTHLQEMIFRISRYIMKYNINNNNEHILCVCWCVCVWGGGGGHCILMGVRRNFSGEGGGGVNVIFQRGYFCTDFLNFFCIVHHPSYIALYMHPC